MKFKWYDMLHYDLKPNKKVHDFKNEKHNDSWSLSNQKIRGHSHLDHS